jgi:CBS domain-containing protein
MLESVKQILDRKGHEVLSIEQDANLYDALRLMRDNNVGALIVLDQGRVVGIFSERDYAREVEFCTDSCQLIKVRDVMSTELYFAKPETSIDEAMAIVTETRCRHLPIMNDEELVGVVSIGDLVKATIDEKEFLIKQLEKYIKGEP